MYRHVIVLMAGVLLSSPLWAQQAADTVAPEVGGAGEQALSNAVRAAQKAKAAGQPVMADDWMIVAANPYATQAGARVLRAGGTAADAAIATQLVLGLVEPQSSGLGGGAFVVWYDAETGRLTTLDGRETAPLQAKPQLFQDENGEPIKFFDAVVGGRSVGTREHPLCLKRFMNAGGISHGAACLVMQSPWPSRGLKSLIVWQDRSRAMLIVWPGFRRLPRISCRVVNRCLLERC